MKQEIKQRFLNIYNEEADSIFRYCLFRISNRENALDLTQDVFMKFWESLSGGTDIKNGRAFLFMIARNSVIDFYRKKKALSLDSILEEDEDNIFMAVEGSRKEDLEFSAEAKLLLGKLTELSPSDSQLIYLRFIEELKPGEIAEILKITPNAVSVRIIRAMERFREITGYNIEK
ncbi:MAG: sigma-70 family RNA polymerase sigma factor [Minisyncoccia bacterium]